MHTGFSRGRSGGLVFPSLSEFSTVYCDPHSRDPSKLRPRLSAQKPRPLGFGQHGDPLPDLPTEPCQLALTSPGFPTLTAQSPTFRPLRVLGAPPHPQNTLSFQLHLQSRSPCLFSPLSHFFSWSTCPEDLTASAPKPTITIPLLPTHPPLQIRILKQATYTLEFSEPYLAHSFIWSASKYIPDTFISSFLFFFFLVNIYSLYFFFTFYKLRNMSYISFRYMMWFDVSIYCKMIGTLFTLKIPQFSATGVWFSLFSPKAAPPSASQSLQHWSETLTVQPILAGPRPIHIKMIPLHPSVSQERPKIVIVIFLVFMRLDKGVKSMCQGKGGRNRLLCFITTAGSGSRTRVLNTTNDDDEKWWVLTVCHELS